MTVWRTRIELEKRALMTITICGSIKSFEAKMKIQKDLGLHRHTVLASSKTSGVDYQAEDDSIRVQVKKSRKFIDEHFPKI